MPDTRHAVAPSYEEDFYAWALHQAALLRELREWHPNVPLDLDNLVEEVDGLANSLKSAVRRRVALILEHFLKLQFSPASDPRRQWENSVDHARTELEDDLTPTLEREVVAELDQLYARTRRVTARVLTRRDEHAAAAALPERCPYSWAQIRDEDWYPAPPA
jgi:Domain of unknown function DUF29